MRIFLVISLALATCFSYSCNETQAGNVQQNPAIKAAMFQANDSPSNTVITGKLSTCTLDSMRLFRPDGTALKPILAVPLNRESQGVSFEISLSNVEQGFYYIGGGGRNNTKLMVLGKDPQITVMGQCRNLKNARLVDAPSTNAYQRVKAQGAQFQKEFTGMLGRYRQNMHNPDGKAKIEAEMAELDARKMALLDSMEVYDPFMAKVFSLSTYLSYPNNKGEFATEGQYFASKFFQFSDLTDPDFERIPHVHEAFKSYARTIVRVGIKRDDQAKYTAMTLADIPKPSTTHRMAILGLAHGFKSTNGPLFIQYGEEYIATYGDLNAPMASQLQTQVNAEKAVAIGIEAPNISLPTPEGEEFSLTDLRGKVVLIDFWASWCGPCRRENPNVVKLYNEYKDQGFDILSVSLDSNKDSWKKAIAQDGLDWHHVSDLKKWRSAPAQTYGVNSIPYTVLIDRDGKIIGKQLRGLKLERKLAEVFSEGSGK